MNHFGLGDWAILAVYFFGSLSLGAYFSKTHEDAEDYFLAGRNMPWLPVALSIVATNTSAVSYMGIVSYVYVNNVMLYFVVVTLVLITPLVLRLFLPFYYNLKVYTAYEYLELRFSPLVRSVASALFIFLRLCWLAAMLYATSIALAEITGISQVNCGLFLGLGTSIYTTLGGMKGVIWTDVLQAAVFLSGIVIMAFVILTDFNWDIGAIYSIADAAGRTRLFDFSLDPTVDVTFWGVFIGYFVINLALYGVDQVSLQRYLTAKDLGSSRRSVIANACIDAPASTALFVVAIGIYSYFQKHASALPADFAPDRALPYFIVSALPQGISGLLIAGIMAATMSSMSSGVNSITTATVVDFYQRYFRRHESPGHYLNVSRGLCFFWGMVATLGGLFVGRLGTILVISVKTNSFFTGILLGIFLLGILTVRANWQGVALGALLGLAVVIYVGTMTRVSYLWYAPLGLLWTMSLGYLLSALFAPIDPQRLRGLVVGYGAGGEDSR